jgi:NAD(P)-dependent dehydrogenase (short-subunit alcohol dehydrogenase family)
MKDLKGMVVALTGAGSGLGRALGIHFADHGARLA